MALLTTFAATRRSRRRRTLLTILAGIVAVSAIVVGTTLGYDVGTAQRRAEIERLVADLAQAREAARIATQRAAQALQRAEASDLRAAQSRTRLEQAQPTADERLLLDAARRQLAAGVPADRLAFVLREARAEPACERGFETRRLTVHTAVAAVPASAQSFASGRITVTGEAPASPGVDGTAAAGYDPTRPVTLRFLKIGREMSTVEGIPPLGHAVVIEGREHRFAARVGDRPGTVEITMQTCRFP